MKSFGICLLWVAAGAVAQDSRPQYTSPAAEKLPVRVLYTGEASHPRTVDFLAFLSATFVKVDAVPLEKLLAASAKDYDVVIIDAPAKVGEGASFVGLGLTEQREWKKPTILMGAAGGSFLVRQQIKLNWLALSLKGGGHGLAASHPIFTSPFASGAAETESVPTPAPYGKYPEGLEFGAKMNVWRVHSDPLTPNDDGLVSDGYGFGDSPDCETIAGGLNTIGPNSVAIGRQGNFLLWGFCAPPAAMTESARKAFLNSVVYIKNFGAAPILVRDPVRARDWAFIIAKDLGDKEAGGSAERSFSPELLAAAKGNPGTLAELLSEGLPWLRADRKKIKETRDGETFESEVTVFSIDEEVRAYGVRIDEPQLIDTMLNIIGHGEDIEKCHRILVRYLGFDLGPDIRHWFSWWSKNKDRAFFSETAGYRFVIPEVETTAEIRRLAKFSSPADK